MQNTQETSRVNICTKTWLLMGWMDGKGKHAPRINLSDAVQREVLADYLRAFLLGQHCGVSVDGVRQLVRKVFPPN